MKMAKASEADLSMAMDLANVLGDIEKGYFPAKFSDDPESEETEWLDTKDREQFARLIDGLQKLLDRGSISRVIWGMAVVCDPANELIDPAADFLEHHPIRQQMEDALLWALSPAEVCSVPVIPRIRLMLGIGPDGRLTDDQLARATAFGKGGAA